jgi:hypothetical protein
MDIKDVNEWTIISLLLILAGILFYVSWGITYGVWMDIGIYSVVIVLLISGICGFFLSTIYRQEETD